MNASQKKYIILIGDGMAGRPLKELNGKTTLEAANTPNLDILVKKGIIGMTQNVPAGMHPGSDIASMSIFGYDPRQQFTGRAPLEAAAMGIQLKTSDVAYRCNFVTIENETMVDFTAGHIDKYQARNLIKKLNEKLGKKYIQFYSGVSYRNLMVIRSGPLKINLVPPHDITGKKIYNYLPEEESAQIINQLMFDSRKILAKERTAATQIWIWGQGQKPQLQTITEKYKIKGTVITAVDLLKGLGLCAGLNAPNVKGATGFIDTNYSAKVAAGISALEKEDLLILHIEAPDECGHMGDIKLKIKAIEDFDSKVVGPLVKKLQEKNYPFNLLVLPDHPTPIELKTHSADPVPFVFYNSEKPVVGSADKYSEKNGLASGLVVPEGKNLLEKLINAGF